MNVKRIQYGKTFIPESWVFEGGNPDKQVPIVLSFFLVTIDDKCILVDVGSDTMKGFILKDFVKPVDALKREGIEAEQITDVIITHSHSDHIEAVKYYKNATVYIQKDEYIRGKKYIPDGFKVVTFDNGTELNNALKVIKIGGHSTGSSIVEIADGEKTAVLCGDECYTFYNLDNKIPTASSFSKENSTAFVMKYSDERYNCLLCHDVR